MDVPIAESVAGVACASAILVLGAQCLINGLNKTAAAGCLMSLHCCFAGVLLGRVRGRKGVLPL